MPTIFLHFVSKVDGLEPKTRAVNFRKVRHEEREKQRDLNEIILREKHEMERKVAYFISHNVIIEWL